MSDAHDDPYFVSEVMTASPQALRLMLIEGALQKARRAAELWSEHRFIDAGEFVDRCRCILAELMARMNRDKQPELTEKVYGLYSWMHTEITEAHGLHDTARLAGVIRVLEIERETWRQLCEMLPGAPLPADDKKSKAVSPVHSPAAAPLAVPLADDSLADAWGELPSSGFSADA